MVLNSTIWVLAACLAVATATSHGRSQKKIPAVEVYSNAFFSTEGGDWVGSDLVLSHDSGNDSGYIVFYESYWLEPTKRALCINDLRMKDGVGHFSLHWEKSLGKYTLKFHENGVVLSRDDAGSVGPVPLKKQREVTTVLKRIRHFSDSDPCVHRKN